MVIATPGAALPEGRRRPAIVPDAYRLLAGWCYLERGLLQHWAGWGRIDRAAAQAKSDVESLRLRDILDGKARPATGVSAATAAGGDLYNPASTGAEMTLLDPRAQAHYRELLTILRERQPLKNAATAPLRPHLPM